MSRRPILQNIMHILSGQVVAMLLGLLTHAYLARVLGPGDYGILGFVVSVVSYFGILATLGTDIWGARAIARKDEDTSSLTGHVVSLRLGLSLVSLLLLVVLINAWTESRLVNTVILIQAASLFIAAITLDFAFQGIEQLNVAARRQMIAAFLALTGVLAFLQFRESVVTAALVFQGAALVAALYMLFVFRKSVAPLPLSVNLGVWRRIINYSLPLAVTGIVNAVYFSIDVVIIGLVLGKEEVGLYVAAGRVMAVGFSAAGILTTAFLPVLSRLVSDRAERHEASAHLARIALFTGGLIAAGGFLFAPEIIRILFGEAFAGAELALRLLMINLAAAYAVAVYHLQLVAWNHEREQMFVMIAGAVANVVLNLIFIPKFGIEAAAATTLASTLFVFALAYLILARHSDERHEKIIGVNWVFFGFFAWAGFEALRRIDLFGTPPLHRFIIFGGLATLLYVALGWAVRLMKPTEVHRYLTRDQN